MNGHNETARGGLVRLKLSLTSAIHETIAMIQSMFFTAARHAIFWQYLAIMAAT